MIRSDQLAFKPLGDIPDALVAVGASPSENQQPHDDRQDGPLHGQKQ
jgi:hypothetical protein